MPGGVPAQDIINSFEQGKKGCDFMKRTKKVLAGMLSVILAVSILPIDSFASYAREPQSVIELGAGKDVDNGQAGIVNDETKPDETKTQESGIEETESEGSQPEEDRTEGSQPEEDRTEEGQPEEGRTEGSNTEEDSTEESNTEETEDEVEAETDDADKTGADGKIEDIATEGKQIFKEAALAEGELYKLDFSGCTEGETTTLPDGWKPQISLNENGSEGESKTVHGTIVKDGDNLYYKYSRPSSDGSASPYIGMKYGDVISGGTSLPDQYAFSFDFQCEENGTYQLFFNNDAVSYDYQAIRIQIIKNNSSVTVKAHDGSGYNISLISGQTVNVSSWITLSLVVDNVAKKYKAVLKKGEEQFYASAEPQAFSYRINTTAENETVAAKATSFLVECPKDGAISMDNISIKKTDEMFGSEVDENRPEDALYWEGFNTSQYTSGDYNKVPEFWKSDGSKNPTAKIAEAESNKYYEWTRGDSDPAYIGLVFSEVLDAALPGQYVLSYDVKFEQNGSYKMFLCKNYRRFMMQM